MNTPEFDNSSASFRVADWMVRPTACEILRDNEVIKLEPRVMDLLQFLASRPGEVFTRNQLEEQVWPGMVVGYDALTKSIGKLREAFGDTEKPSNYIQTIPKKGYRLIAPVSTDTDEDERKTKSAPKSYKIHRPFISRNAAIGFAFSIVLISVFLIIYSQNSQKPSSVDHPVDITDRPSLVVLPFRNLNDDTRQDYFSRGITDDLITDLSGYSGIDVVSSRIAFQFHGRVVDINTLVKELGVRYVVEGSLRRTAEQIRINVQMVDTRSGINVWAEQYNRPLTALFDIQDEVRSRIFSALSVKLSEAERKLEQKRYTNNYAAYDAFLRGQHSLIKRASADDNLRARDYFEQAIAIDPGFARAYAALAMANTDAYRHDWVENPDTNARIALQQAKHALKLDPDSRHASMAMGYVEFFVSGNHKKAAAMAERTLQLDPKNADANMLLAIIYVHSGEPEKAEAYVESGIRLSTKQSSLYIGIGALANLLQGNYQEAYLRYKHSLQINPERLLGKIYMTITLVRMNRLEEARWYAEEIMASGSNFNAERWAIKQPYKNRDINLRLRDDLRKAGLQ